MITLKKEELENKKKPFIVFYGPEVKEDYHILAKILSKLDVYFVETEGDLQIDLNTIEKTLTFKNDYHPRIVANWVEDAVSPLLSNLLNETPDNRIISAVQSKMPILFMLDIEQDKR